MGQLFLSMIQLKTDLLQPVIDFECQIQMGCDFVNGRAVGD